MRLFTIACVLFPLSVCAAEESTAQPDRWAKHMQEFDQQDQEHPYPKGGIVFTGSSSIRLWDLEESFPNAELLNRGFGGSQIHDAVRHLDRLVLRHQPRIVVLYSGDNDINAGRSPGDVVADFQSFVDGIHKELPETKIVYIAIKPSLRRWNLAEPMSQANADIQKICEATAGCEYVDVWSPMLGADGKPRKELFVKDGLHLSSEGYALWTKLTAPHLTSPVPASSGSQPGNAR